MILNLFLLLVGFIALIKGADIFVKGSSDAAKNLKVPAVIIGLTIVAFGTSAPELAVSVSAALQGSNEISVSNVVGSNIFNLLIVLGVCAMFQPLTVDRNFLKRDMPISILITAITLILCLIAGKVSIQELMVLSSGDEAGYVYHWVGIVLLIGFAIYLFILVKDAKKNPEIPDDSDYLPMWKSIVLIIVGLVLVIFGGQVVVNSAKEIAKMAGMTETLIGLTIVAVGTSLPELVTSIVATKKGETGLAIGNVVGSNIFNILFILGVSGTVHPIAVNMATIVDMIVLFAVSVIAFVYSITAQKIKRFEGLSMVLIYIIYIAYAIAR
jgi:cation:H+ antiporter